MSFLQDNSKNILDQSFSEGRGGDCNFTTFQQIVGLPDWTFRSESCSLATKNVCGIEFKTQSTPYQIELMVQWFGEDHQIRLDVFELCGHFEEQQLNQLSSGQSRKIGIDFHAQPFKSAYFGDQKIINIPKHWLLRLPKKLSIVQFSACRCILLLLLTMGEAIRPWQMGKLQAFVHLPLCLLVWQPTDHLGCQSNWTIPYDHSVQALLEREASWP